MIESVVGFLGAGQMAQALAAGFVRAGLASDSNVVAHDPNTAVGKRFAERVGSGVRLLESGADVAEAAGVVVIAVKPAHVESALSAAAPKLTPDKLVVSVVAGVTIERLQALAPEGAPIVRVMPNTPCLIGRGASCYARGPHASFEHGELVKSLLSSVGTASETPEGLLDAVTGLSGSGPAFVYTFLEAMADGGVRAGLPRTLAAELAAQTVVGAAEMVIASGQHPAVLRDAVASPAGTTVAGLGELERRATRAAIAEAVVAAAQRSKELGQSE